MGRQASCSSPSADPRSSRPGRGGVVVAAVRVREVLGVVRDEAVVVARVGQASASGGAVHLDEEGVCDAVLLAVERCLLAERPLDHATLVVSTRLEALACLQEVANLAETTSG